MFICTYIYINVYINPDIYIYLSLADLVLRFFIEAEGDGARRHVLDRMQPACTCYSARSPWSQVHSLKPKLVQPIENVRRDRMHPASIQDQLLSRKVERFRGGLVYKDHRLLCQATLDSKERQKKKPACRVDDATPRVWCALLRLWARCIPSGNEVAHLVERLATTL